MTKDNVTVLSDETIAIIGKINRMKKVADNIFEDRCTAAEGLAEIQRENFAQTYGGNDLPHRVWIELYHARAQAGSPATN